MKKKPEEPDAPDIDQSQRAWEDIQKGLEEIKQRQLRRRIAKSKLKARKEASLDKLHQRPGKLALQIEKNIKKAKKK